MSKELFAQFMKDIVLWSKTDDGYKGTFTDERAPGVDEAIDMLLKKHMSRNVPVTRKRGSETTIYIYTETESDTLKELTGISPELLCAKKRSSKEL